jgi:exosortase/archaeosortase family protein
LISPLKQFLLYTLKFLGIFCIAYFGTIAWIGLAAPGNYYSAFIDHHLDYVSWLRASLLHGSRLLLAVFGIDIIIPDAYSLSIANGAAVHIGYDCIGYGVMSFWLAFVIANKGSFYKKIKWVAGGLIIIWGINILRICLFLLSINKKQGMPLGVDNHTFFNITAYIAIFIMIWFYDRNSKINS